MSVSYSDHDPYIDRDDPIDSDNNMHHDHYYTYSDPAAESECSQLSDQFSDTLHIYTVNNEKGLNNTSEWSVTLRTPYEAGKGAVKMFIDTQAQCNVISLKTFRRKMAVFL